MAEIYGSATVFGGAGGCDLNIDYGANAPSDTSKLWIPNNGNKPDNVEINGRNMQFGQEYLESWDGISQTYFSGHVPSCCVSYNGKIYMFGGKYNYSFTSTKIVIYDIATK